MVLHIIEWIRQQHPKVPVESVFIDHDTEAFGRRPPTIEGHVPDIYVFHDGLTIVGEAKTPADVESRHSRSQYNAFLTYLSRQPNSSFVFAAPWHVINAGASLVTATKRKVGADSVKTVYLRRLPA